MEMRQCHSKMPNPISVETRVTSNRHCRSITASFGWGRARGHIEASAEHRFISRRGALMSVVLAVANSRRSRSVVARKRGSVACERMLSNMSFERSVKHGGPRLSAATAAWPAAQLDR